MDQKNLKVTWATTGMLGSATHLAKKTNNSLRCGSNSSRLLELLNVSDGGGSFGKTDYYSGFRLIIGKTLSTDITPYLSNSFLICVAPSSLNT